MSTLHAPASLAFCVFLKLTKLSRKGLCTNRSLRLEDSAPPSSLESSSLSHFFKKVFPDHVTWSTPVLSTPVSLVSTQQSRSPDPEPRRIWKEAGFSFPLTGKQGLKCVYCPHAQYSGYEDSPGDTLSCTFTLACTPIYVCVCLSPNIQLEYSSSLSHPILKSAKSWCPDVRPGR